MADVNVVLPSKEPALRVVPMPADANQHGDIFGGWVMAQVDIAGGVVAARRARGRVATVAVNSFVFKQPVLIGDLVTLLRGNHPGRTHVGHRRRRGLRAAQSDRPRHGQGDGGEPHVRGDRGRPAAAPGASSVGAAGANSHFCNTRRNAVPGLP